MGKLSFRRDVLRALHDELPEEERDEMAIPSYLHRNPMVAWIVSRRMHLVIGAMNLDTKPSILDFGCGTGMLLLQLPPGSCSYYGVDLDTAPAEEVLRAHGRSDFELLDARDWEERIGSGTLDYIVALEVLEHVDDVPHLARLFGEKLRPDGKLIVSGPTENRMYRLGRRMAGFSGHYHHRDIYEINGDIEREGFQRIEQVKMPFAGPLALFVISTFRPPEFSVECCP